MFIFEIFSFQNLGDHDRVIDEYERARSLYSDTDNEIFQKYLDEVESGTVELKDRPYFHYLYNICLCFSGIAKLKVELSTKLREEDMPLDQRKRLIANLVQLGESIF